MDALAARRATKVLLRDYAVGLPGRTSARLAPLSHPTMITACRRLRVTNGSESVVLDDHAERDPLRQYLG